jgi:PKD repeat protein
MRSLRLLAGATAALILVSGCSDNNGGTPPTENRPPVAGFSEVCTNLSCVFTDTSTDPDGNNTIASRLWAFGDGTPNSDNTNPTHAYATAGTYTVVLTVTDNENATNQFTKQVTVTAPPPGNTPPTASFELPTGCTAGTPCGFHSTSTDPEGNNTIASWDWDFGDGETGEGADATHTYDAAGTYTVTLVVTDNMNATATATQQLVVTPPASQDCTTSGTLVDCTLTVTQRVTVKFTVVSRSCELVGNKLTTTGPVARTVFFHLCNRTVGEEYTLPDDTGAPLVLPAGTPLGIRFHQGTADTGDPAPGDPGVRIDGSYPNWTLNIDDGGAPGTPGEPDFNDAVVSVTATLAP